MALLDYLMPGTLCFLFAFILGVNGEESTPSIEYGMAVSGIGCVVVLVIVVAICVDKRVHTELLDRGPPFWTRNLEFKQEYSAGFTAVSDGMENLSQFQVVRRRLGQSVTDGARWEKGFTEGKHVFEVLWPIAQNRGINSSIGVGVLEVPLKKQGRLTLVGHHSRSWGLDLSSRKAVNGNKPVGSFPRQLPDKFYMYLDLDAGKIGFGEDIKQFGRQALFFGNIINSIKLNKVDPLYVMVGMCSSKEEVQLFYIGTAVQAGGFDLIPSDPPMPQAVIVQQHVVQYLPPAPAVYQPTQAVYQPTQ